MSKGSPSTPPYIVHRLDEKSVTSDWFFARGHYGTKIVQGALLIVCWFFGVLPVVITADAIRHRHNDTLGWWSHTEGYALWDITILLLSILVVLFIFGFLLLYFRNRAMAKQRRKSKNYHEELLAQRLEVAQALFAKKFGPAVLRSEQRTVRIEPYADLETYELRDQYHAHGVD